jgi:capsular polysaccharide biosynthesis protein
VQPASYSATAAGPRRLVVLAMGLLVAGLTALGVVLLSAWLNPLITTAEQLAQVLDIPVAGFIPRGDLAVAA